MSTYSFIAYSADALVYDAANNTWSLRPDYDPDLHRVEISITDDDAYFGGDNFNDEIGNDGNQVATVSGIDGSPIASGQVYDEEFHVISSPESGPIWVETVEIAGQHVGYLVSAPLDINLTYTETTTMDAADEADDSDTPQGNTAAYSTFANVPQCYAPGSLIETYHGPRAVETIKPGDLIWTQDHGTQAVRWTCSGFQPLEGIECDAKPVLISSGALGHNRPAKDLIVSPHHRILVGGHGQLNQFFQAEVFVPAKALIGLPGIRHMNGRADIIWTHLACDRHEVITANGCLTESLLLGPIVLNGMPPAKRRVVTKLFKSARPAPDAALNGSPARKCLTVGEVKHQLSKRKKWRTGSSLDEIKKWDRDLAMEAHEANQLHRNGALSDFNAPSTDVA